MGILEEAGSSAPAIEVQGGRGERSEPVGVMHRRERERTEALEGSARGLAGSRMLLGGRVDKWSGEESS